MLVSAGPGDGNDGVDIPLPKDDVPDLPDDAPQEAKQEDAPPADDTSGTLFYPCYALALRPLAGTTGHLGQGC